MLKCVDGKSLNMGITQFSGKEENITFGNPWLAAKEAYKKRVVVARAIAIYNTQEAKPRPRRSSKLTKLCYQMYKLLLCTAFPLSLLLYVSILVLSL